MQSYFKVKVAGIFLSLLLILSGCSNNAVPATTIPANADTQKKTSDSAKDTTPTTVVPGQMLKVSYIDVGQADSILIQIPNGKNVLIDASNLASV